MSLEPQGIHYGVNSTPTLPTLSQRSASYLTQRSSYLVKPAPDDDQPLVATGGEGATRRNEELNFLLVIAGLLAATITSFIIYIQPMLKPDPGDDSAALLRILVYNADNAAFGSDVPTPPVWGGPPAGLVASELLLYCSLCGALVCGCYVMLVKFFTDSFSLGWKNWFLDILTRWMFFFMYLLLAGVFFGTFVALLLQIPFLPPTSTVAKFGALGKVHTY